MRTRLMLSTCLIAGIMFLCGSACLAEVYYVDQKHPHASDDNPGSEEMPWKTINKAVGTAEADDTVWIKAGTYREDAHP